MGVNVVDDHAICAHPAFRFLVEPKSSSSNMLDDVLVFKGFADVAAGGLTVAEDRREPKDPVEGFVSLCGEKDRGTESSDIGWEVYEEMELRLRDQNAWSALCGQR